MYKVLSKNLWQHWDKTDKVYCTHCYESISTYL